MRMSVTAIFVILTLFTHAAEAQRGNGKSEAAVRGTPVGTCDSLRGGTPGLHGLCVAYCVARDQSNVDMNDIASVRAAAPSVKLLERYNSMKREADPEMPCFADAGGSEVPDELPEPTSCACWTSEQLSLIDGVLDPVRGKVSAAHCTLNASDSGIYEAQVYEGYDVGTAEETVVNSAFAYYDPEDDSVQGCMSQSPTGGFLNFTLQHRAEAQYCIQTIAAQCDAIDQ